MAISTPLRIILFIGIVLAAYCLWPRTPSIIDFEPKKLGVELNKAWAAEAKSAGGGIWQEYFLHEQVYHIPPIDSLFMASNLAEAHKLMHSEQASEQERAQMQFRDYYERLKKLTNASFDPVKAAILDIAWQAPPEGADPTQSLAELMALIYGGEAAGYNETAIAWLKAKKATAEATDKNSRVLAKDATVATCKLLKTAITESRALSGTAQ